MGKFRAGLTLSFLLIFGSSTLADTIQIGHPAVSIVESGTGDGRRFTVIADNADITDLLKQLFVKTGDEFAIEQGVAGAINLKVKDATLDEVFRRIAEVSRPTIKIRREAGRFRVTQDPVTTSGGLPIVVPTNNTATIQRMLTPYPQPYQALAPGNRLVSIDVPKDKPIALSQALARFSSQAGFPVRLDPRVPAELTFSGTITSASLAMTLQAIADASGLKIVDYGSSALLVPSDQFQLRYNQVTVGSNAVDMCPNCGERLAPWWKFCPNCGQAHQTQRTAPARTGSPVRKIPR